MADTINLPRATVDEIARLAATRTHDWLENISPALSDDEKQQVYAAEYAAARAEVLARA